jgi:Ca2+-binding EF-hand superfamily protein
MFDFFDKENKGYVDLEDLRRVLSDVSTDKEILTAFEDNDKNKDGKLDLREFMHILLPVDLDI